MLRRPLASGMMIGLFLLCSAAVARGQTSAFHAPVVLTVVDENELPVSEAQVTVSEPGLPAVQLQTDYAGRCSYSLHRDASYQIRVEKPGFYETQSCRRTSRKTGFSESSSELPSHTASHRQLN